MDDLAETMETLGSGEVRYLTVEHRKACAEAAIRLRSGHTAPQVDLRPQIHARLQKGGPMHAMVADLAKLIAG